MAASRVYLPATRSIGNAIDPAAAWDDLNAYDRRGLALGRTGNTLANKGAAETNSSATNALDKLVRQYIAKLAAQTITGTLKGQIRAMESAAGANFIAQIIVRVVAPDGTVRGTLYGGTTNTTGAPATPPEFATSLTNRNFPSSADSPPVTLSSVTAQEGDLLVVEIGARANNTVTTNYTATLHLGDSASSDLAENETGTTANNPWLEFSNEVFLQKIENLTDDFSGGSVDYTKWPRVFGTPSPAWGSGKLVITAPATATYCGVDTDGYFYDLRGSQFIVQVPTYLANPNGSSETLIELVGRATTDTVDGVVCGKSGANFMADVRLNSTSDSGGYWATGTDANHRWWRIREASGTLYVDTSPDRTTWTNRRSIATPAWANSVSVVLRAGYWDSTAPVPTTTAEFDNVNVVPSVSVDVLPAAATGAGVAPTSGSAPSVPTAASTGAAPAPTSSVSIAVPPAAATAAAPAPTSSLASAAPAAGSTGAASAAAPVIAPPIDSVSADFASMPAWLDNNSFDASVVGGHLNLPATSIYSWAAPSGVYDLRGRAMTVEVVQVPGASSQLMFEMQKVDLFTGAPDASGDKASMYFIDGLLQVHLVEGGVNTTVYSGTWDPVAFRYWRIRESSGTIYWGASGDGHTWAEVSATYTTLPVSQLRPVFAAGSWSGTPPPGQFDNVNIAPPVSVDALAASSTGSATAPTASISVDVESVSAQASSNGLYGNIPLSALVDDFSDAALDESGTYIVEDGVARWECVRSVAISDGRVVLGGAGASSYILAPDTSGDYPLYAPTYYGLDEIFFKIESDASYYSFDLVNAFTGAQITLSKSGDELDIFSTDNNGYDETYVSAPPEYIWWRVQLDGTTLRMHGSPDGFAWTQVYERTGWDDDGAPYRPDFYASAGTTYLDNINVAPIPIDVDALPANATGAALAPTSSFATDASTAAVTASAPAPSVGYGAEADLSPAGATAASPAPQTSTELDASTAASTGAAPPPTITTTGLPVSLDVSAAAGTGSANPLSTALSVAGRSAASTASGRDPSTSLGLAASTAAATSTAWPPTASEAYAINVDAAPSTASAAPPSTSASASPQPAPASFRFRSTSVTAITLASAQASTQAWPPSITSSKIETFGPAIAAGLLARAQAGSLNRAPTGAQFSGGHTGDVAVPTTGLLTTARS